MDRKAPSLSPTQIEQGPTVPSSVLLRCRLLKHSSSTPAQELLRRRLACCCSLDDDDLGLGYGGEQKFGCRPSFSFTGSGLAADVMATGLKTRRGRADGERLAAIGRAASISPSSLPSLSFSISLSHVQWPSKAAAPAMALTASHRSSWARTRRPWWRLLPWPAGAAAPAGALAARAPSSRPPVKRRRREARHTGR
ncbi:hypothetical protein C2845_PM02G03690 [Panicum miliaceum]|uniref:Uncharacterized protein n=1 Tax=Panicum miliaceum TaxID=4540 RepID=A0A3L6SHY0_PANMI|nr:hypothetical protein C2845_PM02G03690 [Panicum miliaceum]